MRSFIYTIFLCYAKTKTSFTSINDNTMDIKNLQIWYRIKWYVVSGSLCNFCIICTSLNLVFGSARAFSALHSAVRSDQASCTHDWCLIAERLSFLCVRRLRLLVLRPCPSVSLFSSGPKSIWTCKTLRSLSGLLRVPWCFLRLHCCCVLWVLRFSQGSQSK